MKKVLLAIDGITPERRAFSYAVQLCKRVQADLSVLQVITPVNYEKYLKRIREKTSYAKKYIESSLVAATFAEAGEHDTASDLMSEALKNINQLLPESEKAGIQYHLTMKAGDPGKEIIEYVNMHRDVILTIYDAARKSPGKTDTGDKNTSVAGEIRQMLSIPLVVLHGLQ